MGMRSVGIVLLLGAAACRREEAPAVSTAPLSGAADAPNVATASSAAANVPRPPEGTWTDWGPWVNGVRMRAKVPRRVLQGDEVDAEFDFEFDAAAAPAGTTHFITNEVRYRTWLVGKGGGAGRAIEVAPYDEHMPHFASEEDRHPLSGPPPQHLGATYYLSTAWQTLSPGSYEARLEFRDSAERARMGTDQVGWQPPRVWTGILSTAPFEFTVDEAPLERAEFKVPTRLTLRMSPLADGIEVIYTAADSSVCEADVHHGFVIGFDCWSSDGGGSLQCGVPEPDGATSFSFFGTDRTGPFHVTYELTVFETPVHPGHMWDPDPTTPGYRVLWTGNFTVEATAAEMAALSK